MNEEMFVLIISVIAIILNVAAAIMRMKNGR
jgi:hypothetical protein